MASRQEEPSELDNGLVAFFETISVWIIGIVGVIILGSIFMITIRFIIGLSQGFNI